MGLLDIFGGGKTPQRAVKLKAKVVQKYGDPVTRQKAIDQLGDMKVPEAVTSLLARFTITVEPQTTDAEEKERVFQLVKGFGREAVEPVKVFLRRSDQASSWAVRILSDLLPEAEVVGAAADILQALGAEYARDPEKKLVLLHFLEGKDDARVAPAAAPFLHDMSDDVKIAALKILAPAKYEPAREEVLQLLAGEDTARRVRTAALAALHESGFGVQGYREKVEGLLVEPYHLDREGRVQKRA
ncbi:MAG TPA: HEAT repeat domain-containing protein [Myxococcaceae bacterium]|nr:HEAT repeat domain-containing protein [Myxococcaceae bacterium]